MTSVPQKRNREEVMQQQSELLEARSLPLRNYLMTYVMPSLSQAMLDCCAQKPDDPIDYLVRPTVTPGFL